MTDIPPPTFLNRIDNFPALPATVSKVMSVTADPESSAQDLMQAVLPDQSMCATILKFSNSAFFGLPRQVSTIDKAVMVLGFNEIRNIVLGKAVFNSFRHVYKNNREIIGLFWKHSFVTGLAAKIIAEEIRLSASEFFVAGLIHDIGKLAMLMSLDSDYASLLDLSGPIQFRRYLAEQELFSISHDDVGYRLLRRWLFPETLLLTTGYHHRPQEAPANSLSPAVIQVADILSLFQCNPDGTNADDIITIIDDFFPEIRQLWRENNLDWDRKDFVRWQKELASSIERDSAILSHITT